MKHRTLILSSLVCVAVVAVPVACQESVPPDYQLVQPRVLAIRSTPPDVLPGAQVTLDSLVYAPAGTAAPTYSWSWCASLDSSLQCGTTAAALTTLLDPDGSLGVTIDYDLGTNPTATFALPANVTPGVIQAACSRRAGLDAGGEDGGEDAGEDASVDAGAAASSDDAGFDAGLSFAGGLGCNSSNWTVDILLTVSVGSTELQAVRTLTIDFTTPDTSNTNPTIDGVAPFTNAGTISDAGPFAMPGEEGDGAVADAAVGPSVLGVVNLAADVPLTATDTYGRTAFGGFTLPPGFDASAILQLLDAGALPDASVCVPVDAAAFDEDAGDAGVDLVTLDGGTCVELASAEYESLDIAWYVESGQLNEATTSMPSVTYGQPQDWSAVLQNGWTPPSGGGAYRMILVARDNRGGVGWVTQTVTSVAQ